MTQALQELQYKLSVEWDQKDTAFKNKALKTFNDQIKALQARGVTQIEIVQELKAQTLDAQTAKELDQIAKIAKEQKLSKAEIENQVNRYIEKAQTKGASWSDDTTATILILAIVALFIVAVLAGAQFEIYVDGYYEDDYTDDEDYDCYYDTFWHEYVCDSY